jgi:hypothetical protein
MEVRTAAFVTDGFIVAAIRADNPSAASWSGSVTRFT